MLDHSVYWRLNSGGPLGKRKTNTLFRTAVDNLSLTATPNGEMQENQCAELIGRYEQIIVEKRLSWTTHLRLLRQLGAGGQGIVYLTERRGSDGFWGWGWHPAKDSGQV